MIKQAELLPQPGREQDQLGVDVRALLATLRVGPTDAIGVFIIAARLDVGDGVIMETAMYLISGQKIFEMQIGEGSTINKVQFDKANEKLFVGTIDGQFFVLDNKELKIIDQENVASSPIEDILIYPRNNQVVLKS